MLKTTLHYRISGSHSSGYSYLLGQCHTWIKCQKRDFSTIHSIWCKSFVLSLLFSFNHYQSENVLILKTYMAFWVCCHVAWVSTILYGIISYKTIVLILTDMWTPCLLYTSNHRVFHILFGREIQYHCSISETFITTVTFLDMTEQRITNHHQGWAKPFNKL
jgi:hypothetical protein